MSSELIDARIDHLLTLNRVARELFNLVDSGRILELVLGESLKATGFLGGYAAIQDFLPQQEPDNYTEFVSQGCAAPGNLALDIDVIQTKQTRFIPHLEQKDSVSGDPGIQASLVIPFTYRPFKAGVIHLHSADSAAPDEQTIEFLENLVKQTGAALENAQRYQVMLAQNQGLRDRTEQIVQLAQVGRVIHQDQSLEEILQDLALAIKDGIGFNLVLLSLVEGTGAERSLRRVAAAGLEPLMWERLKQIRQPFGRVEVLLQDEFRIGNAFFIPEERREIYQASLDTHTVLEDRGALGPTDWHAGDLFFIPLQAASGEILGVLSLDDPSSKLRPTAETIHPVEIFANQAAASVEKARLYAEARQRAAELDRHTQRLRKLIDISEAISQSFDVTHIAQVTAREAAAMVGVDQSELILLDDTAEIGRVVAASPPLLDQDAPDTVPIRGNPVIEEIIASRQTLVFEDAQGYAMPSPMGERMIKRNVLSVAFIPLVAGGRLVGILCLESTQQRRAFSDQDTNLVQSITNQAAVALENARSYSQARYRAQVQEALLELGTALVSTRSPTDLVHLVLNTAVDTIPNATEGAIHLYSPGTNELLPEAVRLSDGPDVSSLLGTEMTLGVAAARRALAEQRIINIPDFLSSEFSGPEEISPGFQSLLIAPLITEDRLLGTITVASTEIAAFSSENENILALLATQASVALENARLHAASQSALQELEERAERLATVNRLSAQFGSTLDSQEVMDIVVHEMARITTVDQCNLVLFDPNLGYGTVQAEYIPIKGTVDRIVPMEGNPSYEILLNTRKPLSIEDVSTHPATAVMRSRFEADGVKSLLLIPLVVQDRLIGSVGLNVLGRKRSFGDAEVEMCAIIGNQAAIALENARLYEKVREFTTELEQRVEERTLDVARERDRVSTLLRITTELATSLDLDRILYRALELVSEAIGASQGSIFLLDQITGQLVYQAAIGQAERLPPEGKRIPFRRGEGLIGWVIQHRQPAVVYDTQSDERWLPIPVLGETHRSVLAAPFFTGEDVWGVLMLFSPQAQAFSKDQLQLVETAASQVSPAIYNAELYKLIREQSEQLGSMMRAEREETAKTVAMLESVADGVMVVDSQSKVILFNAAAEHIFELDRSQIVGEPIKKFISIWGKAGETWGAALEEWTHAQETELTRHFLEDRLDLGDKVISVHLAPVVYVASGLPEFLGTVSVFRDITKDVELDRMQREWVSTVSHELRTPMTSIKGYADLLILGAVGPVSDPQRNFLEIIKNNADRLSTLVNDLLDISRIETGRMKLDMKAIDLYDLVEMVINNLRGRREQEEKEMSISTSLPQNLPHVKGDIDRVTQILTNLLDNAFNYTPSGGKITLAADSQPREKLVRIAVTDTGIGIAAEDQIKILDRFYRSDHPDVQKVSGTGLGLAIVHHLVEMHGGELSIYSEGIGKGSTFSFTLPIARDRATMDNQDGQDTNSRR